ncbi:hypothetical protein AU467_30230 [Mesorhizobium loti]|uniref:Uncharacterized protein n=1 Tax=Rhizobium loti TaxID=381 RepID=A0A117N225_RHILI|nr:hypothetical protein AU467_30230 [Mesorhizobium loti]
MSTLDRTEAIRIAINDSAGGQKQSIASVDDFMKELERTRSGEWAISDEYLSYCLMVSSPIASTLSFFVTGSQRSNQ